MKMSEIISIKAAALTWALFSAGALAGQGLSREAVGQEVQKHFANPKPDFAFVEELSGEGDLAKLVNSFFKDNFLYVDYLSRESKTYREGLIDSVCSFLEAQGREVSGFAPGQKLSTTLHELKAVAARNIYPLRITPEGKIGTLICASAAGFKDYPGRNISLEAFAFQTIFNDAKKEGSLILAKVKECAELARSMKLSANPDDAIKRAQGMFWILFYKDQDFERLLVEAYQERAGILPFKVVSGPESPL